MHKTNFTGQLGWAVKNFTDAALRTHVCASLLVPVSAQAEA